MAKKISFTVTDRRTASTRIWVANRDGSNAHALFPGERESARDCCAKWTADGKHLLFERYREGHSNIWVWNERELWFNRKPQALQLTNGPLDFTAPSPSRDGKRLFGRGRAVLARNCCATTEYPGSERSSAVYQPATWHFQRMGSG